MGFFRKIFHPIQTIRARRAKKKADKDARETPVVMSGSGGPRRAASPEEIRRLDELRKKGH